MVRAGDVPFVLAYVVDADGHGRRVSDAPPVSSPSRRSSSPRPQRRRPETRLAAKKIARMDDARSIVERYYAAFNARDMPAFLALVTDDVVHDINQGGREVGRGAFTAFMGRMNGSYRETLVEIDVMTNRDGTRAAAEFVVLGEYLAADEGLPSASGQRYRLAAGAFFELRDGKVARITNYYNLADWIAQVDGGA